MKRLLFAFVLLFSWSALAPTYDNKFTTNKVPESIPWTNTANGGITAKIYTGSASNLTDLNATNLFGFVPTNSIHELDTNMFSAGAIAWIRSLTNTAGLILNLTNNNKWAGTNILTSDAYNDLIGGGGSGDSTNIMHQSFTNLGIRGSGNSITWLGSPWALLVGGSNNIISSNFPYSTLVGGMNNRIFNGNGSNPGMDFIGGGNGNHIDNSEFSFIGGGQGNTMDSGTILTILGGSYNHAEGWGNTIVSGQGNSINDGFIHGNSTILGGYSNLVTASDAFVIGSGNIQEMGLADYPDQSMWIGYGNVAQTQNVFMVGQGLTNSTPNSIEIGVSDATKARFSTNGLELTGPGTNEFPEVYVTGGLRMPDGTRYTSLSTLGLSYTNSTNTTLQSGVISGYSIGTNSAAENLTGTIDPDRLGAGGIRSPLYFYNTAGGVSIPSGGSGATGFYENNGVTLTNAGKYIISIVSIPTYTFLSIERHITAVGITNSGQFAKWDTIDTYYRDSGSASWGGCTYSNGIMDSQWYSSNGISGSLIYLYAAAATNAALTNMGVKFDEWGIVRTVSMPVGIGGGTNNFAFIPTSTNIWTVTNVPSSVTFVVTNSGTAQGNPAVSLASATGLSLAYGSPTNLGDIAPGGSASFAVTYAPTVAGTNTGVALTISGSTAAASVNSYATNAAMSFLMTENFNSGLVNSGWGSTNADFNYTASPIEGAASLFLTNGTWAVYTNSSAEADLYIKLKYKVSASFGADVIWAIGSDSSDTWPPAYFITGDTVNRFHISNTSGVTDAISNGTIYYMWLHHKSDGTSTFEWNTTNTEVGSGAHFQTCSHGATSLKFFKFRNTDATANITLDEVKFATTAIGSN